MGSIISAIQDFLGVALLGGTVLFFAGEIKEWEKEIREGKEQKLDTDIPPPIENIINDEFKKKEADQPKRPPKPLDIVRY